MSFVQDEAVTTESPIIRRDSIAFDFDYGLPGFPEVYSVALERTGQDRFEGRFTVRGSEHVSGSVKCRRYIGAAGTALVGEWVEDRKRHLWFAEFLMTNIKSTLSRSRKSRRPGTIKSD